MEERIKALGDTNKLTTELAVSNAKAYLEKNTINLKLDLQIPRMQSILQLTMP